MYRTVVVSLLAMMLSAPALAEPQKQQQDESWGWKAAVITSLVLTMATNPVHADKGGMAFQTSSDAGALKMMFRWHPEESLGYIGDVRISNYFHVAYAKWQSYEDSTQEGANNVLEFIPTFRLDWNPNSFLGYVETSIGVALFSSTEINDRDFGSNFQFTDSMAVGGYVGRWDWSLQFQHYSNNSIELPNNGINFYNFNLTYKY